MGGPLTTGLGELAAKGISKLSPELGEYASKTFSTFADVASRSPAGQALYKVVKGPLEQTQHQIETKMTRKAMADFKATGQFTQTPADIKSQSFNMAKQRIFGPNHGLAATYISHAAMTHGDNYAQLLADHLAMYLQDTTKDALGADVSKMKLDVRRNKGLASQFFKTVVQPGKADPQLVNTFDTTSVYQNKEPWEKSAMNYFSVMQLPFLALKHIGTVGNNLVAPLESFTKGLIDIATPHNYQATKTTLLNTGAFGDTLLSSYRDLFNYRNGLVAKVTGSPNLGYIIGKAIHHPGFEAVRDITLVMSGAVGKHEAEYFAQRFAKNVGDKLAASRLEQMGLNPAMIAQQAGRLTPQQMERAVYRAIDNRAFLFSKAERSYYSQKSPITRIATMYHGYVLRQAAFIKNEFMTAWKSGDAAHITKVMAALIVAFPAIGSLTEMLEDYTMMKNGAKNEKDRYAVLFGRDGLFPAVAQYLDFYSHIGGLGMAVSYSRALLRNQLAGMFTGPVLGTIFQDAQDVFHYGHQAMFGKKGADASQLGRDALEQIVPVVGRPIAHAVLPTKAEQKERKGSYSIKKLKGIKGIKRLQSLQ